MSAKNHYVYTLIDPKTSDPYYIGKGKNDRIKEHFQPNKLKTCGNRHKVNKIKKLRREGYDPKKYYQKVETELSKEKAFELEKFIISEVGIKNLTNIHEGGKGGRNEKGIEKATGEKSKVSKLTEQKASEIKWLVNNSRMKLENIADQYDISLSVVSHIRIGRTWNHVDESKPDWYEGNQENRLSPDEKKAKRKQRVSEVKWLTNNTEMTYKEIAEKYNVHKNTIKKDVWDRLDQATASRPDWYEGPIVDLEKKKKEKQRRIAEIKWLCENTNMYQKEIAKRYDVKPHRVSDLKNERVKEHINPKEPK
jgi:hypothetical protein